MLIAEYILRLTRDYLKTATDDVHVDLVDTEKEQKQQYAEEHPKTRDSYEKCRRSKRVSEYRVEVLERSVADPTVSEGNKLAQLIQSDVADSGTPRHKRTRSRTA